MLAVVLLILLPLAFSDKLTLIGAGVGDLYVAQRMIDAGVISGSDVYIFEKTFRVGGRAHTLRHTFPTRSSVDIGAHKFKIPEHQITSSLVSMFNLSTASYNKGFSKDKDRVNLRNNYTGKMKTSAELPYFFEIKEQWDNGAPEVEYEILAMYPFVVEALANLTSEDPSVYYPTLTRVLDQLRYTKVKGMLPNQLNIMSSLDHSSEFKQWWVDTQGEALSTLPLVNNYDGVRSMAYYGREVSGVSQKRVIVNANGDEIGYSTISEKLLESVLSKGARIYYGKEAVGVYETDNGKFKVKFADGSNHVTEKLVLGLAKKDLLGLSRDSIIFTNATSKAIYELFDPVCAVKGYLYYNTSWWLPIINNEISTTNDLRYAELLDSNTDGGGGYVNFVYADGLDYCRYYETVRYNKSDPEVVIYANTTDVIHQRMAKEINKMWKDTVKKLLKKANVSSDIPDFEILAMGVWESAWHQVPASNYLGGEPSKLALQPLSGKHIYIVNEFASVDQGWAEGSLIMAEKAAKKMGVNTRPSWLGNEYWYQAVIVGDI